MFRLIKKLGVCALVMGLQGGLSFAVSAAPINEEWQSTDQQVWGTHEREAVALKQQEVDRHEQAMLRMDNESVLDWQWRQSSEHELHIRNMQQSQDDGQNFTGTPVKWRVSSMHRP